MLINLALACGSVLAASALALANAPGLFTRDVTIWPLIRSFGPFAALALIGMGYAQVLEGVLLGTGDLAFLSWSQVLNVLSAFMCFQLARAASLGIHGAWAVFIAFVTSRALQSLLRVFVWRKPWLVETSCDADGSVVTVVNKDV